MTARRGLTLIEVLVATMLLAAIAAACLPLLSSATRTAAAAAAPPSAPEPAELARLAAAYMGDPGGFGAAALPAEGETQRVDWPDDAPWPPVTVTRREFGAPEPDHAWLVFSCGGVTASAWAPIVAPPAAAEDAGPAGDAGAGKSEGHAP